MKKIISFISFFLVFALIASQLSFAVGETKTYENIIDLENPAIDSTNVTGISTWSAIPFVSQENLADGYTGGEGCQHMNSVTRDTQDGSLIFIGTDVGGLFRSTDGGQSWVPCNRGINTRGVCRVAIDPMNKRHLVALACAGSALIYNALYYSYDMGDHWKRSKNSQFGTCGGYYIYNTMKFDPSSYDESLGYCTDIFWSTPYERDSSTKMTAEQAGLYFSTDGGANFQKFESELNIFDGIMIITGSGLIQLANQYGIFTQTQKHGAFTQIYEGNIRSFLLVDDLYYIMTDEGIFTSADLVTFTEIESTSFPKNREPRSLDVSSIDPEHMVMVAKKSSINYSQRPYYSEDGGKTWTLADISDESGIFYYYTYSSNGFSFNQSKAGEVVAFQGGVAIMSKDWGKTWKCSNTGINNIMCGGKFSFNLYNSDLLYIGCQDFGGALSIDGGKTWKNVQLSKDNDGKDIYGGYAADENTFFGVYTEQWADSTKRANERYVCFSHDGGKTVNITKTQLEADATQFENIHVYSKIKCSWESSYQSPTDKNVLFCANYRSTDNGYTWENMLETEDDVQCLQVYTHSGTTLYGAYNSGGYVVKSDDNGETWQKVNETALTGTDYHVADIAVDSENGYIFTAYSSKLYRMDLDGNNIVDLTGKMEKDNMGVRRIITVCVDPNEPEIVYCGGSGDYYQSTCGTRRSCDSGETWYTVSPSDSTDCIVTDGITFGFEPKCLRVNPKTGELWNGSSCLGFNKLEPPYENSVSAANEDITVTYDYGFNSTAAVLKTKSNRIINEIDEPTRENYEFLGWYTDESLENEFEFGKRQAQSLTLYAKWQVYEPNGHIFIQDEAVPPTCETDGLTVGEHCSLCGFVRIEQTVIEKTGHIDSDGDGYCDICNKQIKVIEPDNPDEPEIQCNHMCHQNGMMGFLWKIINIFNKLFGVNQYCACGAKHW